MISNVTQQKKRPVIQVAFFRLNAVQKKNAPEDEWGLLAGPHRQSGAFRCGTHETIRTSDLPLRRRLLYPAELHGLVLCHCKRKPGPCQAADPVILAFLYRS